MSAPGKLSSVGVHEVRCSKRRFGLGRIWRFWKYGWSRKPQFFYFDLIKTDVYMAVEGGMGNQLVLNLPSVADWGVLSLRVTYDDNPQDFLLYPIIPYRNPESVGDGRCCYVRNGVRNWMWHALASISWRKRFRSSRSG